MKLKVRANESYPMTTSLQNIDSVHFTYLTSRRTSLCDGWILMLINDAVSTTDITRAVPRGGGGGGRLTQSIRLAFSIRCL